jgi:hypothetical protein
VALVVHRFDIARGCHDLLGRAGGRQCPIRDRVIIAGVGRSFDPELSATWIEHSLFGLLLKGCEGAGSGEFPRHTVAPLIIRAFERGICPLQ